LGALWLWDALVVPRLAQPALTQVARAAPTDSALPDDMLVAGDEVAALRRFLVARKWDVDKAEAQLRRTLAWRANEFQVGPFLARAPRATHQGRAQAAREALG
jgi:hypothetical protein